MLRTAINLVLIITLISFVGLLTSFFFLGSNYTYEIQLQDLPNYFARRFLGGIVFGLICSVIIILINLILNNIIKENKTNLFKLFLFTGLSSLLASLIGTAIFFNQ